MQRPCSKAVLQLQGCLATCACTAEVLQRGPHLQLRAVCRGVDSHEGAALGSRRKELAVQAERQRREPGRVRLYKLGTPHVVQLHPHLHRRHPLESILHVVGWSEAALRAQLRSNSMPIAQTGRLAWFGQSEVGKQLCSVSIHAQMPQCKANAASAAKTQAMSMPRCCRRDVDPVVVAPLRRCVLLGRTWLQDGRWERAAPGRHGGQGTPAPCAPAAQRRPSGR